MKKIFTSAILTIAIFISSISIANASTLSPIALARLANTSCINFKIKGICIKHKHGHIKIGIKIEMWKPVLLVETVKKPFDTNLPLVSTFSSFVPSNIASSGSINYESQRALQFNEVHIMSFPFSFFLSVIGNIVPFWCGGLEAPFPTVYYLTELDFLNWRQTADMFTLKGFLGNTLSLFKVCDLVNLPKSASDTYDFAKSTVNTVGKVGHGVAGGHGFTKDLSNAMDQATSQLSHAVGNLQQQISHLTGQIGKQLGFSGFHISGINLGNMCVGTWGVLYPRAGWNPNESEVVGSAMDAFRAASWDADVKQPKVSFLPLPFTPSLSDKLQLALPRMSGCIKIGENPMLWDLGLVSPDGKYLWVYWKHFECCKF